jgi:hypothetical protein
MLTRRITQCARRRAIRHPFFYSQRFNSQDSFFGKFSESFKRQLEENKQLNENIKLLQSETTKVVESDTMKRAKEVYNKAKVLVLNVFADLGL